jgi:hypothetical protein
MAKREGPVERWLAKEKKSESAAESRPAREPHTEDWLGQSGISERLAHAGTRRAWNA